MRDEHGRDEAPARWPLGFGAVAVVGSAFVAGVLIINVIVRVLYAHVVKFDFPPFWPLGMVVPRLPALHQIVIACASVILFYGIVRLLRRVSYRLWIAIAAAVVLVLSSNLIQGWRDGFITPIAGGGETGIQCWHDAVRIEHPLDFVRRYVESQPGLLVHASTHPPGAVLAIYALHRLLGNPAAISLAIACIAVISTMLFLYGILAGEFGAGRLPRYLIFLFMLVPSVQIYYVACIDALIASALLGAAFFFLRKRTATAIAGMVVCTFIASFMTFGFLFIIPVLVVTELVVDRRLVRSGVTILLVAALYLVVDRVLGFNYLASFRTAAAIENPRGFMLFADPASYVFTRLEGMLEIIVFLGPFLAILALRGIPLLRAAGTRLSTIAIAAPATLVAMLLTGAFRTGETARCCIFIYPYLLIPAAWYIRRMELTRREELVLCAVVFAQTVGMQLFGRYFW
jgi:hypothetical protein